MADIFGKLDSETPGNRAPGTVFNAGIRSYENVFDLAEAGGGSQDDLVGGNIRDGNKVMGAVMSSTVSLAAVNFTVGTDADPDKYGAAQAGPAAGATVRFAIPVAALAADALASMETVKFFASAALPATGTIVTRIETTKR